MSSHFVTDEPPERPSLQAGTEAHYSDAGYYDRAYRRHRADLNFYLQTALEHGAPILELGCGTGRITLPLARAGLDIVGVDSSIEMLERAQEKLSTQADDVRSLVEFRQGDIRSFRFERDRQRGKGKPQKFRLIISPFNVMQHLYSLDDIERCLEMVRQHLMPRAGRFVFDVLMPDVRSFSRNPTRQYKLGKIYHPAGDKRYNYTESFDYDPVSQVQYIRMYFEDPDDPGGSFETPLCHRQFFPAELEALLRYNGFEVVHRFGDFARNPLEEYSDSQIFVCRLGRK